VRTTGASIAGARSGSNQAGERAAGRWKPQYEEGQRAL